MIHFRILFTAPVCPARRESIRGNGGLIAMKMESGREPIMKTPLNGNVIRQHMTYSWWKYILVAVVAIMGVNLYFTVSSYRPPEEKKVDVYVYGYADDVSFQAYMDKVRETQMPDMEEMLLQVITPDETYGPMQLSTYMAAGEGDIYILPKDQFIGFATQGALIPLEEEEELMNIFNSAGISLQRGWRKDTYENRTRLFGIPISALQGFNRYFSVNDGFLCVLVTNQNDENVMKFMNILCQDMLEQTNTETEEETGEDAATQAEEAVGEATNAETLENAEETSAMEADETP